MCRRPRPAREAVVTWEHGRRILLHGSLLAAVMLIAFWAAYRGHADRLPHARAVTFCVAAFAQLFFAFACRSDRIPIWRQGLAGNPALSIAVVVSMLLQIAVVMLPFARPIFEIGGHLDVEWALVLAVSLVPLLVVEAGKAWRPRGQPRPVSDAANRAGC